MRITTHVTVAVVAVVVAAATPFPMGAQRVVPALDVGASAVRYTDAGSISATSVSPALRVESTTATFTASGTLSSIASGGWTTQGALTASRFVPFTPRVHGELGTTAGGSAHEDQTRTGQLVAQARAHFMGNDRGFWAGGGLGRTWDGATARRLTQLDVGAWVSNGHGTIVAALTPTSLSDVSASALRYTDLTVGTRLLAARTELTASLGARVGSDLPATSGSAAWGSVTGAVWLVGPVALAASAGTYPVDYTQGYPGGRFASLALRLSRPPKSLRASDDTVLAAARSTATVAGPIESFSVVGSANRYYRTIVVGARAASTVEVSGDFTGWRPVQLTRRRDGQWVATVAIPAGTHEIALRVDGGAWVAPPGFAVIRDEFGGTSGLLVIR